MSIEQIDPSNPEQPQPATECAECKRLRKALDDISDHPFLADIDSEAVSNIIADAFASPGPTLGAKVDETG